MFKNYILKGLFLVTLLFQTSFGWTQTLVHYWNFNDNASIASITNPTQTLGGATLNAIPGGISVIDFANGVNQNFNVQNLNAQNGDVFGTHLRFNDPIGGALEFALPTTGFQNSIVKFATRRSNNGAGNQLWSYSIDGTNYIPFLTFVPNNGDPTLATLDFSAITATNNNPNFKLKVEFTQGSGSTTGNNRFDNFTLEGNSIGGGDTVAPIASFIPSNGSTNVGTSINLTIGFNEDVRLVDDSPVTNTNVDALIELRLNNASGTLVPFDATVSGNTITIDPTSVLANNQPYYIALLPNAIEDVSNNVIATTSTATFTTGNPSASFASNFLTVNEIAGNLLVTINLVSPTTSSVDLVVKTAPFSTADSNDFTLSTQTLNFTDSSDLTQTITIPITDDTLEEQQAEYFVLSLENPSGITLTGTILSK